jgi:glycosyltransferase involved in cell wall biosynthesis
VEGQWQRVQLNAISALADSVYGSIEAITSQLAALRPRRPVTHLPVGSNLPDRRERRAYARETLRLEAGELVIATFGTGHADRLPGHIAAGVNAVAAVAPVTLLNLGANAPEIPQLDTRVRTVHPGAEPLQRVAERLASADLFMCAWRDGVSTKRGSLMAGLQHALPVLGTCGPNTDTLLRDSVDALQLVSVTDRPQFAMAASALAVDPPAREALGRAGRALYELRFSWDVIAARILSDLERGNR